MTFYYELYESDEPSIMEKVYPVWVEWNTAYLNLQQIKASNYLGSSLIEKELEDILVTLADEIYQLINPKAS